MGKTIKLFEKEDCSLYVKRLLECFLHCVKWQGQSFGICCCTATFQAFVFNFSLNFNPTDRSGSFLNTVHPVKDVRQSRPCTGCWCCCRCCPKRCRLLGPDERDRRHRWTLCWSAPQRASTSLGLKHSASG